MRPLLAEVKSCEKMRTTRDLLGSVMGGTPATSGWMMDTAGVIPSCWSADTSSVTMAIMRMPFRCVAAGTGRRPRVVFHQRCSVAVSV